MSERSATASGVNSSAAMMVPRSGEPGLRIVGQGQERGAKRRAGTAEQRFGRLLRGAPAPGQVADRSAGKVLALQGFAVVRRQLRHGGVDPVAGLFADQ